MTLRVALSPGGALAAFASYRRFIVYKLVWLPEKGKHDKIPCAYATGKSSNAHDISIQTDWQTAIMAAERLGKDYGVGYVFNAADGFFFLDIDKCRIGDKWSELAQQLLSRFHGAAVEVSVSGTGLHVFGRGIAGKHASKNIPLAIELYTDSRFVALTGTGAIGDCSKDFTQSLAWLVENYFPPSKEEVFQWTDFGIPEKEDKALLDRMIASKSAYSFFGDKASFSDLYFANEPILAKNYPDSGKRTYDASSADMALAQHLAFWTRKDCQRMWRLIWTSKLRRQKWDDRPEYVRDTILAACARQNEVLPQRMDPVKPGAPPPADAVTPVGRAPVALCLTTDQGNAKRINSAFGTRIMYSAGGWYGWDGTRWVPDMNYVWECAQQLSTLIRDEAKHWRAQAEAARAAGHPEGGFQEDQHAESLEKFIPTAESRETKSAALDELAKLCSVNMETIDADPWLLNTLSGVIDLRDGSIRPHDSSLRITKIASVNYDPKAQCPGFEKFLSEIMREDTVPMDFRHKCGFLQRWFGYCATGLTNEQKFAVHYGGGANGKSTLIDVIASILGSQYASEAAPGMLTGKSESRHPTDIADLRGRRMVTSSETKDDEVMKEDFVKRATGGDRLKGRHMRQDFFEFIPTHKLQLLTNHRPRILGTDYAIWRRVMLIPYLVTFGSQEEIDRGVVDKLKDPMLSEKLKQEREGILAWVVRGAVAWHQQGGLNPPAEVLQATAEYRNDQDAMGQFVRDQCEIGKDFSVPMHGTAGFSECLYPRYCVWVKENGGHPLGTKRFEGELQRVVKTIQLVTERRTSPIDGRSVNIKIVRGLR